MRYAVFLILALVPVCLIGWVARQGHHPSPSMPSEAAASAHSERAEETTAPGTNRADAALARVFARPIDAAKVKDKVTFYHDNELFEAIDGAAPLFLDRHFRTLARADMEMDNGAELACDVYDMSEPEYAGAIFLAERSRSSKPVDDMPDAVAAKGSFIFRSGPYYVKLTAFDKQAEAALPAVARTLRERIR